MISLDDEELKYGHLVYQIEPVVVGTILLSEYVLTPFLVTRYPTLDGKVGVYRQKHNAVSAGITYLENQKQAFERRHAG